ncbi:amino acid adenylation domain-containing protein [Pseudonocardia spinosispora]|uniref:amino acid adenylation domain-containing protein n=1 Tax=Pseudonocardia spinosispora TaxID=103441 RepID=UPI00146FB5AE|nr:amino acid adenylation domain-containing protein [Pseudonocardia spinosispora]
MGHSQVTSAHRGPAPGPVLSGAVRELPGRSLTHLMERAVRRGPHAEAVRTANGVLSFQQLWDRVADHAAALVESGIGPGEFVALWAHRTEEIVAAALATMAVGAAYVPIDPRYPDARVAAILTEADPAALLVDDELDGPPNDGAVPVISLRSVARTRRSAPLEPGPAPDDAAYLLFTSGSSGRPKGVVVEHRSLVNYCTWWSEVVGRHRGGTPVFGSLGFDHTITTLWPTLLCGAPITLCNGLWDTAPLLTPPGSPHAAIKFTPSQLRFLERTARPDYRRACRILVLGGEVLEPSLIDGIAERLADVRLVNHYGPTETTVGVCRHEFTADETGDGSSVPIGRPIHNTRLYLTRPDLGPVAFGEPGELVVAGTPVARGYLRGGRGGFLDEAELGGPPGRAYRTGDQVRLRPDATVEYLGRLDRQVKVNGHRIELDELRHGALAVDGVADAAFTVTDEFMQRVEAFVVCAPGTDPGQVSTQVRALIARRVPAAVVPWTVTVVPEIAMTVHGKHDLAAVRRSQS